MWSIFCWSLIPLSIFWIYRSGQEYCALEMIRCHLTDNSRTVGTCLQCSWNGPVEPSINGSDISFRKSKVRFQIDVPSISYVTSSSRYSTGSIVDEIISNGFKKIWARAISFFSQVEVSLDELLIQSKSSFFIWGGECESFSCSWLRMDREIHLFDEFLRWANHTECFRQAENRWTISQDEGR